MYTVPVKRSFALLLLAFLAPSWPLCAAESLLETGGSEQASSIGSTLRVSAADGYIIDARISEIALAQVLRALEARIGLRTKLSDPSMAEVPISVELRAVSLEHALPAILEGFSYVIYPVEGTLTVSILSTPPKSHGKNRRQIAASPGESLVSAKGEAGSLGGTEGMLSPATAQMASESGPQDGEPRSLDEFQAIVREEESAPTLDLGEEGSNNPPSDAENHQRYTEAVVDRALAALVSGHHHLKQEAINQLASLEDSQATEALRQAIDGNLGIDAALRAAAVVALWENAADTGFTNKEAVNIFQRLARGSDAELRSIAKKALENVRQVQQVRSRLPPPRGISGTDHN